MQVPTCFSQDIIDNQAVPDFAMYLLPTLYALVIVGSVIGNVLVITAVLRSPNMRKVSPFKLINKTVYIFNMEN